MLQDNVFGRRLAALRKEKNISQYKLAELLMYSRGQIANYEQGKRKPDFETLGNFADFFGVSIDYLLGRTNIRQSLNNIDMHYIIRNENIRLSVGEVPLSQEQRLAVLRALENPAIFQTLKPVLGQIHAGIPILAEQNWESQVEIPSHQKVDFVLRVIGNSMIYAGINSGDLALFKQSSIAQNGQIVAVGIEDTVWNAYLKLYIQKEEQVLLRSANPDYEDIEFGPQHRIVGVMVGLIREQTPCLGDYLNMLQLKRTNNKQWVEIIEAAGTYSIKPEKVKAILDMHWELSKK
ncbi:MAG: S24 family peptidase [Desulfotomaculaceae bacterium]